MPNATTRILGNSSGNAILAGLGIAVLVAAASVASYQRFNDTYANARISRAKAKMAVVESQVKRRALQPEAYLNCASDSIASCQVNILYFSDLGYRKVVGTQCADGTKDCGVTIDNLTFTPATRAFTATVGYTGTDAHLKPSYISLEIPLEILQAPVFHCGDRDPTKPLLAGFETNGAPICKGLNSCPVGQFARAVDISRRTIVCKDLPGAVGCGEQSMFTNAVWQGGAVDYACGQLPDPPFTSALNTRRLASSSSSGGGGGSGTVTVTETSTSTVTQTVVATGPGGSSTDTNISTSTGTPHQFYKYRWDWTGWETQWAYVVTDDPQCTLNPMFNPDPSKPGPFPNGYVARAPAGTPHGIGGIPYDGIKCSVIPL